MLSVSVSPRANRESSGRSGNTGACHCNLRAWATWTAISLAIGLAVIARPVAAAAFDFNDGTWEGGSEFLNLARQRLSVPRVVLAASINFSDLTPADGLVIIHPTVSLSTDSLNDFMLSGGRVAVLDDFGTAGPFLERFEIRRTNPPHHPAEALRGNPNLAWAVPVNLHLDTPNDAPHGLVVGLSRLLTNHSTVLTNPGLTPLLEIRTTDGEAFPLAVSGLIGKRGRLLVVGDPSVVINQMLRYPENRLFAEHLVDYMVSDDTWGPRGGRIYLLANGFSQVPLQDNLLSPRRAASRARETWLAMAQARIPEHVAWFLGLLSAVAIGRMAWRACGRRPNVYRPRFAAAEPLVSQPGIAGRAAVLGAPTTPRALVMLELMSGFTAYLSSALRVSDSQQPAQVFELARDSQLINQSQHEALSRLSKLVVRLQVALAAGGQARVRRDELNRAHRLMLDIVETIEHRQRSDFRPASDARRD